MRCKHCKTTFTPIRFNIKYCLSTDECRSAATKEGIEKQQAKQKKDWAKEKKIRSIKIMSSSEYRSKYILPLVQHLARIIDNEQPCIATGSIVGKMSGGHCHSVGSNPTLAINLHNIHIQSFASNGPKGGDHTKYRHGLIEIYGQEYADFVDMELLQCPPLHLSKDDLVGVKAILSVIVREYKKLNKVYSSKERIELRNKLNVELGIYSEQFSTFKTNRNER